jgi:clan AA aspartic protease (TIGR02281 family)
MRVFKKSSSLLLLIFMAISTEPASADQVILKNGRILECSILSETADTVEISFGTGSMSLSQKTVHKLVRNSGSETEEPARRGNILNKQHAPPQYASVAEAFRGLMNQRNKAADARYMTHYFTKKIKTAENQIEVRQREIQKLTLQLSEKRKELAAIPLPKEETSNRTPADPTYNERVEQHNQLYSDMNSIYAQISPLEQEQQTARQNILNYQQEQKKLAVPIAQYLNAFDRFIPLYTKTKQRLPSNLDAPARELFDTIDRYLARFKSEMDINTIQATHKGHSTMVRAIVNGTQAGDFVFDTGATLMTISESFARKLGLEPSELPQITTVVADGRKVESGIAVLSSVMVGTATVNEVEVIILPDSPMEQQDGLLGMSFLKHFSISINGANGELELTRFSTD